MPSLYDLLGYKAADEKANPWHGNRESVFAAMREVDRWVNSYNEQSRKIAPRYGTLSVGSADFDYTLKYLIGSEFLRSLRNGKTPQDAYEDAKQCGRDVVTKWNTARCKSRVSINGIHELKRWENAGDSDADFFLSIFNSSLVGLDES